MNIPTDVPTPLGAYAAVVVRRGIGYVSGQFPIVAGQVALPGRVGAELDEAQGRAAARIAALNVLGQIDKHVPGGIAAIELARVDGCIACVRGFGNLPAVLDGASETFVEVLGRRGLHARSLVPVSHLPRGAAIELVVTFHLLAAG